jgi:hypothetical protein
LRKQYPRKTQKKKLNFSNLKTNFPPRNPPSPPFESCVVCHHGETKLCHSAIDILYARLRVKIYNLTSLSQKIWSISLLIIKCETQSCYRRNFFILQDECFLLYISLLTMNLAIAFGTPTAAHRVLSGQNRNYSFYTPPPHPTPSADGKIWPLGAPAAFHTGEHIQRIRGWR